MIPREQTYVEGKKDVCIAPRKPDTMTQLEILTVQDVADRLRISKSSVYELTRYRGSMRGSRLPARKVGKQLRFLAAEVDQWFLSLPQNVKPQRRKYQKRKTKKLQPSNQPCSQNSHQKLSPSAPKMPVDSG